MMRTGALESSRSNACRTVGFCLACVTLPEIRWEYLRASQNSAESPTIAPRAPITMIGQSSSLPWAATVEAAFRVVSPGKIGITASRAIRTNTEM